MRSPPCSPPSSPQLASSRLLTLLSLCRIPGGSFEIMVRPSLASSVRARAVADLTSSSSKTSASARASRSPRSWGASVSLSLSLRALHLAQRAVANDVLLVLAAPSSSSPPLAEPSSQPLPLPMYLRCCALRSVPCPETSFDLSRASTGSTRLVRGCESGRGPSGRLDAQLLGLLLLLGLFGGLAGLRPRLVEPAEGEESRGRKGERRTRSARGGGGTRGARSAAVSFCGRQHLKSYDMMEYRESPD